MNKNLKIILSVLFLILALAIVFNNVEKSEDKSDDIINESKYTIEEIKNEINATADTNMYEIQEEYDGRKIIQIKADLQYETMLAGILKNSKPEEEEIKSILEKSPTESGAWISKQSRERFLKLLDNNNISGYEVNDEGYLQKVDGNYVKINQLIESDKLYIIDISGKYYTRDELSGKIIEYPFEDMDPYMVSVLVQSHERTLPAYC